MGYYDSRSKERQGRFDFSINPDGRLSLREAIGQALGFVSVCWDPKPDGVFDSELAEQAAEALERYLLRTFGRLNALAADIHTTAVEHGWWGDLSDYREGHWRPDPDRPGHGRNFGEIIALIHSEASEALEDYRRGEDFGTLSYAYKAKPGQPVVPDVRLNGSGDLEYRLDDWEADRWEPVSPDIMREFGYDVKPVGIPSEMADIIIRVLDACAAYGIDIDKAIAVKTAYNKTRTYRHGGQKA